MGAVIELMLGPTEGPRELTVEQLAVAWEVERERIMQSYRDPARAGNRPWAYWRFELGEEQPDGDSEAIRLAELGELRTDELATLRERANEARLRIDTDEEHKGTEGFPYWPDRDAAALWEAIERGGAR